MKRTLIALALAASFAASAQTANSGSASDSNAGAASQSGAAINASQSGNVSAVGNQNSSSSQSGSNSGASSGSQSGALGNVLEMNNYAPEVQTVIQDLKSHSSSTSQDNVNYSGKIENVSSGTVTNRVEYSGTQTLKNVPSIAMSGPASGPCTGVSGGLSAAGPGWGLGFNGSSVMADCRLRENTRVLGMAMQSFDGTANPQEKGEVTVMFMDSLRALSEYNKKIAAEELKK